MTTLATFSTPIDDRYFEDYVPGSVHELGRRRAALAPPRAPRRRAAKSKPHRGTLIAPMEGWNQKNELVCSLKAVNLLGRRIAAGS